MALAIIGWLIIVALFVVGMIGAIMPILPGTIAIYLAFFVYGWFFGFGELDVWFWLLQSFILIVIFVADYAVSALGVQKFGGSKASVWGSTIGIIVGPFAIPGFGLVLGPFIGAVVAELLRGTDVGTAMKIGFGSVVGMLASTVMKVILQLVMIAAFLLWIFI